MSQMKYSAENIRLSQGSGLDWIEQGLTSPPTQYRLSGRQFYRCGNSFEAR